MVGERHARGSCGKSERQTFGTEPGDGTRPGARYSQRRLTRLLLSYSGKGRARPGWELLYNHYAKVKGMNAPYSQAFAEKERPEGYGERGTAEAGDLGFGTLLYTEE